MYILLGICIIKEANYFWAHNKFVTEKTNNAVFCHSLNIDLIHMRDVV